jgi:hypothetical protein
MLEPFRLVSGVNADMSSQIDPQKKENRDK